MTPRISSNSFVRNLIIFVDFVLLWVMLFLFVKYSALTVLLPDALALASTVAMALGQIGFSSVVYQHYQSFDKVLRRVTLLTFVFEIAVFAICAMLKVLSGQVVSYQVLAWFVGLMYFALVLLRLVEHYIIKSARSRGKNSRFVVFIGNSEQIKDWQNEFDFSATSGLKVLGYYSESEGDAINFPYLGNYEVLSERLGLDERMSDDIYCSLPAVDKDLVNRLICHSMSHSTRFYYLPAFMSDFGHYLVPQLVGDQVVFTNFSEPLMDQSNRLLKRTFDILASSVVLVLLIPFIPIIALIIKMQSPGPIFFKQLRTGLNGADFYCYKFRSMHVNKDADKLQASKDDPRKFAFGNFMRKSNIDELPQFWNVLKGDMSIVGPRPHMLAHTEEYRHKIEEYMLRHYVRPGITGWAQVTGYRGETKELWQMEGRVKRDIWYIQNWSFLLDLRIIFKTAMQVVKRDEKAW